MTEILRPTMLSASSGDPEEEVAFKVLNQDNLPIAIIGEQIVKPFGTNNQKLKPNVIVHPTRRIVTNLQENKDKAFTKSTSHIEKKNKNLKGNLSNSHGNLNYTNSLKLKIEDFKNQIDTKFTKTLGKYILYRKIFYQQFHYIYYYLDAKLKRLQRDERNSKKVTTDIISRKPFVTTVKTGKFLEPPSDAANSIGLKYEDSQKKDFRSKRDAKGKREKIYYAFASQPRVLNRPIPNNVHVSRYTI